MRPVARVRALLLNGLPPELRAALRKARSRAQRVESSVRKRLPEALGGRFESGSLHCRVLTDRDRDALQALRPLAVEPSTSEGRGLGAPNTVVLGALLDGELIASGACIGVGPSDAAPLEHMLFLANYVAPRHRRRGVGQQILLAQLNEARARGARAAFGWVHRDNHASLAMLRAIGFEQVAVADQPSWLVPPGPNRTLVVKQIAVSSGP